MCTCWFCFDSLIVIDYFFICFVRVIFFALLATFLLFIHTVNVVKCNTLLNTLSQDYLQEIVYFVEFCFFCQMRQLRHTGQIREVTACVDNPKYSIFSLHYWKQINNLTCNQILRVSYNDFKLSLHAVMYLFLKHLKTKQDRTGLLEFIWRVPSIGGGSWQLSGTDWSFRWHDSCFPAVNKNKKSM